MPGPQHTQPRQYGDRPDPEGNPRIPNRKQAQRLIARTSTAPLGEGYTMPGSQNRKK